ncbi:hypothetical protein PINS_up018790 [Pythium insidiosum]|nr:hypothetical protein PINS_up013067 [Pythium insidiosum]GLE07961.1 hypothetical protein PINS_up018790 [Pythium insidiosum]
MRVPSPPLNPASEFCVVTARINGSHPMPVELHIGELRGALGLPNHNLLAEGIFKSFVPPQIPATDIPDVDHESEEENDG